MPEQRKTKSLKKKLMTHPHQALKEMGIEIPSSVKIHVRNEEPGSWELVIKQPVKDTSGMSEEELRKLAAGCAFGPSTDW
jgi:hypothetical protein